MRNPFRPTSFLLNVRRNTYAALILICIVGSLMLGFQEILIQRTEKNHGMGNTERVADVITGTSIIQNGSNKSIVSGHDIIRERNQLKDKYKTDKENQKDTLHVNEIKTLIASISHLDSNQEKLDEEPPLISVPPETRKTGKCETQEKIIRKYRETTRHEDLTCKPHKISLQDCLYAKKVYKIDETLQKCIKTDEKIYCNLSRDGVKLKFSCDGRKNCSVFEIHAFSNSSGELEIAGRFRKIKILENGFLEIANSAIQQKSPFLFIMCKNEEERPIGKQLIVLPSITLANNEQNTEQDTAKIETPLPAASVKTPNVNVVLLDSTSRAHFYRSLPAVINKFNYININSTAEVIDFEMFQSVHGHSAENFHALFTGKLFPKSMLDSTKESHKVGINELFSNFKVAGYETLYQDDLCWKQWWGTRMELGSPSSWDALKKEIREAFIDSTGLTFSSCEILKENKIDTPFNGPKSNQICYNGRFQHSYIFRHLHQYHKETSLYNKKPRFSFTTVNTAHDYTGLRVQTLNLDLAHFVEEMSMLPNTLTILLADHGNTYAYYTNAVMEGRYEMFHPSFFMIIPSGVAKWFGDVVMKSIRSNSNRLFTMLDVHSSLEGIAKKALDGELQQGILRTIPANRTCDDLDLRLPNLCVCEGWDTEVRNDSTRVGVMEFAVGTLNNMILEQQESQTQFTTKCTRLSPLYFLNVRERNAGEHLITTVDFRVRSGAGADQAEDIFHVEIQATVDPHDDSMKMKLLSYDRLSQYGVYRECKDDNVDIRLCVCTLKATKISKDDSNTNKDLDNLVKQQPIYPNMPGLLAVFKPEGENCIFEIEKTFYAIDNNGNIESKNAMAVSLEIMNICPHTRFEIFITLKKTNMKTSLALPTITTVQGTQTKFVAVAIKNVPYWESSVRFSLETRLVTQRSHANESSYQ